MTNNKLCKMEEGVHMTRLLPLSAKVHKLDKGITVTGSYAAFIKSSYRNNNLVTCLLNDSFSTLHLQVIWFSMDWTFNFGLVCLDGCTVFISSCNGTLICLSLVTLIHHLAWYRKITIHLKNVYLRQIIRDIRLHPPLLMELEYHSVHAEPYNLQM
jgi:hypothetical protein